MKDKITLDKSTILDIVKNFEGAYDFLPDDLKNDNEIRDALIESLKTKCSKFHNICDKILNEHSSSNSEINTES